MADPARHRGVDLRDPKLERLYRCDAVGGEGDRDGSQGQEIAGNASDRLRRTATFALTRLGRAKDWSGLRRRHSRGPNATVPHFVARRRRRYQAFALPIFGRFQAGAA
jgi:hypothetical protein